MRRAPAARAIPPRRGGPSPASGSAASTISAPLTAKSDQRDAVAPDIAIGKQQFDRALDLGQPLHRRRARSVDDEDRRRAAPLTVADNAEIVRPDLQSIATKRRRPPPPRTRCQGAAARNVATRLNPAFPRRARARLGRASARFRDLRGAGLSLAGRSSPPRGAGLDRASRSGGIAACAAAEHQILEIGHGVVLRLGWGPRVPARSSGGGRGSGSGAVSFSSPQPACASRAAQEAKSRRARRRHPRLRTPPRRAAQRPGGPQGEQGRAQRGDPEPSRDDDQRLDNRSLRLDAAQLRAGRGKYRSAE